MLFHLQEQVTTTRKVQGVIQGSDEVGDLAPVSPDAQAVEV